MIVNDQRFASFLAAGALTLVIFATPTAALSADFQAATPVTAILQSSPADKPVSVTVVRDGNELTYATTARTVGRFLAERGLGLETGDYISPDSDDAIADGMKIVYRQAVPLVLHVDGKKHLVHSAAATVGELLAAQGIALGARDEVRPALDTKPFFHEIVRVVHLASWTAHVRQPIAPKVQHHTDTRLAAGKTRVLDPGCAGLRETVYRVDRRGDEKPTRTVLASRIIRSPRSKVIVAGVATYTSLARVAEMGFASAVHFAGSALHMIATAYTAGCFGCSGITASGVRAGFGVIAVDPRVIPLGTKLFVPGYGRAIAGDTGGAIQGNRIDLGMNTYRDAMQFGRRLVTVYVLR